MQPFSFGSSTSRLTATPPTSKPSPSPGFAFGASGAPTAPATPSPPATPPAGGLDMNALMQAFLQHMMTQDQQAPARQQLQSDALFGRHLGMSGDDHSSSSSNPWGPGGLFTTKGPMAAALTPEQLAQSQGGTAMNQWKFPTMFGANKPQAGVAAPAPQTVPFNMPNPVTGPTSNRTTDAANLQQNRRLYSPGSGRGIPKMF